MTEFMRKPCDTLGVPQIRSINLRSYGISVGNLSTNGESKKENED